MSEQYTQLPDKLDIKGMDAPTFLCSLIAVHNVVVPDEVAGDFDGGKNQMATGYGFPRPEDKIALLGYALEKAKLAQDPHDAALVVAGSIPVIHPWAEGNGRTSRALYRHLARSAPIVPKELNRHARILGVDEEARAEIDLGSVWGSGSTLFLLREELIYKRSDIPYLPYNRQRVRVMGSDSDGVKNTHDSLSAKESIGLDEEGVEDISNAIGMGEKGIARTDSHALKYALVATLSGDELNSISTYKGDIQIADLRKFLETAPSEQKKIFCANIWEYRKLAALVAIDILSDDFGAVTTVKDGERQVSFRDLFLEQSNNFKKATAHGAGALALQ
ncbi:MAG: Fic family protein [Candidatus Saccharimonadales bacterium]